jgi:hypothetical protein
VCQLVAGSLKKSKTDKDCFLLIKIEKAGKVGNLGKIDMEG